MTIPHSSHSGLIITGNNLLFYLLHWINDYDTIHSHRVLDEKCEHDTSELQPSIGDMGETVYAEYNMWSVQRIVE